MKATKENKTQANYDVRIALYKTAKGDAICIRFRESLEQLLVGDNSDRVGVMRVGDRLYFVVRKYDDCKFGDGSACVGNAKLQYSRKEQVDICKPFIGEYTLNYSKERQCYYVDLNERKTFGTIGKSLSMPHNYGKRSVVREPVKPRESTAVVKKKDTNTAPIKKMPVEDTSGDAFFKNLDVRAEQKKEILQLLDILDVDETQTYVRSIIRIVREKINATY